MILLWLIVLLVAWIALKIRRWSEKRIQVFRDKVKEMHPGQNLIFEYPDVIYFKDTDDEFMVLYLQPDDAIVSIKTKFLPEFRWG